MNVSRCDPLRFSGCIVPCATIALLISHGTILAQALDNAAIGRARQWITGGDPEKIRSVIRSFQDVIDPAALDQYRQLLIEGKRAGEARIDSELVAGRDRPTAADTRLEALWAARLRTIGMIPLDAENTFQPASFRAALAETINLEAECSVLFSKPEVAESYAKAPAAERVQSLQRIDAELLRFFPDSGLWLEIHPLQGSFRGAALLERNTRARDYLSECADRPVARDALRKSLIGQPAWISKTFQEISIGRAALGMPALLPHAGLNEILSEWIRREFADGPLPEQSPLEAESQLETLANSRKINSWIRHIFILPSTNPPPGPPRDPLQHGPTVRAVLDPQAASFGFHQSPRGLVLLLAEAASEQ